MIKLTAETGLIVAINTDWITYAQAASPGQDAQTVLTIGLSNGSPHTILVRETLDRVVEMIKHAS